MIESVCLGSAQGVSKLQVKDFYGAHRRLIRSLVPSTPMKCARQGLWKFVSVTRWSATEFRNSLGQEPPITLARSNDGSTLRAVIQGPCGHRQVPPKKRKKLTDYGFNEKWQRPSLYIGDL